MPYGTEILAGVDSRTTTMGFTSGTPDATNPKFTGQYRDLETAAPTTESSLDWFNARYQSGAQGRFQSVDPANAGADPSNPQSWNGYAYVNNNPLSYTDPSGMLTEAGGGGGDDGGDGGLAGVIVTGIVDAFEALFGGGGPPPSIPSKLATPSSPIMGPTFSVTGWGTADTVAPSWSAVDGMIPEVIPGLLFFAQATSSAPKVAKKVPTFRKLFLPSNALSCNGMGHAFYAPPGFSLKTIVAAGLAGGKFNLSAMNNAVGHNGTFDFQRVQDAAGNTTFYSGYTPVSNIAVGAYMYGAGYTSFGAAAIANTFARFNSSNPGDPQQSLFRNLGYDVAAGKGSASCSAP